MEQKEWINSVLNSTNGITKVAPDDTLLLRIQGKINAKNVVPLKIVWAVAASIAVLLSLNFILVSQSKKATEKTELVTSYISKTNQLY